MSRPLMLDCRLYNIGGYDILHPPGPFLVDEVSNGFTHMVMPLILILPSAFKSLNYLTVIV